MCKGENDSEGKLESNGIKGRKKIIYSNDLVWMSQWITTGSSVIIWEGYETSKQVHMRDHEY